MSVDKSSICENPEFRIKFFIFDRKKVLTPNDEKDLVKILNDLEDIVRNALSNIDIKLHILDRAENVSFATLDNKKQLRSEVYLGKDKSVLYDRHCIHLVQHGKELFTVNELMIITKAIKDELHAYLCYDFDTEIYTEIF